MHDHGVAHERVGLHEVIADRAEEEVIDSFLIHGEGDGDALVRLDFFGQEGQIVLEGRQGHLRGVACFPFEVASGGHNQSLGGQPHLAQHIPPEMRDQGMVDTHGALQTHSAGRPCSDTGN